jgi:hypothetical protein
MERMMPLYEAKMLHLYETRWATYEPDGSTRPMTENEKARQLSPMPRYWVPEAEVDRKLGDRSAARRLIGWRRICRSTDARTLVTTQVPKLGFGDSWFLAVPTHDQNQLQAALSSFALDYVARQKLGGTNMNFFTFAQLPLPRDRDLNAVDVVLDRPARAWLDQRVERLNGWLADRGARAQVRAELDALMFHVYGLQRAEVSYVLDTFPIVKRKDEAEFGSYRTKELILAAFDAMEDSKESAEPYKAPWKLEVAR